MADSGIFAGIDTVINTIMIILVISVPLGLWKLVDIGVWLYHHVSIGVH